MKKPFRLLLALLLIGSFALYFSSCSDKDVNETEVIEPTDPYGKTTDDAEALLAILYSTADVDSLPNDWNKASYQEEPTIGKVLDEANPYVRSTGAISAEEAISFFNSITSSSVQKNATSASWSKEGIGSLNLNVVNKDGVYATIDVHIQQLPHLTQIRFINKNLLGENADSKPAYYHIGDVVSTVEDGQTIYWVCVRNCNKNFDKGKSHWVSFQLTDKNYKTYEADAKKNLAKIIVPNKLSSSKSVTEDIDNAVKLFVALSDPITYDTCAAFKDGLGGFGKVTYPTTMIKKMASQWTANAIKERLLSKQVYSDNIMSYKNFDPDGGTITFYYFGHNNSSKEMQLYGRKVYLSWETGLFESQEADASWKKDNQSFSIEPYVKYGYRIWNGIEGDNPLNRTANQALVIRCKTGKELCGKGSGNFWCPGDDPDYTQPFPADAPTKVTEVYRYNENAKEEPFVVGDIAESADGAYWTCIASPCNGNYKTILVTTDKITYSADKKRVTNQDLPSINDIYYVFPLLVNFQGDINRDQVSTFCDYLQNPSTGAFPISQYLQKRLYQGDNKRAGYHTTFAIKSTSKEKQHLLRMIWDVGNRKYGVNLKGFTTYQDGTNMYLEDASNMELVNRYMKTDTVSKNYWIVGNKGPTYRNKAGHSTVDSYLYYKEGTKVNGQTVHGGFADPNDFYSIFMEPIAIIRVRILEPGKYAKDLTHFGLNICDETLPITFKSYMEEKIFNQWDAYYHNSIFLNGSPHPVSWTE